MATSWVLGFGFSSILPCWCLAQVAMVDYCILRILRTMPMAILRISAERYKAQCAVIMIASMSLSANTKHAVVVSVGIGGHKSR